LASSRTHSPRPLASSRRGPASGPVATPSEVALFPLQCDSMYGAVPLELRLLAPSFIFHYCIIRRILSRSFAIIFIVASLPINLGLPLLSAPARLGHSYHTNLSPPSKSRNLCPSACPSDDDRRSGLSL
jgi:hypothetical protein